MVYTKTIVPLGILAFFLFPHADAQKGGWNLYDHMLIKASDKVLYGETMEKVEGTPFLNEDFVTGVVYGYGHKEKFEGVPMRYNIYADVIEFKQNNQIYILDPEPRIRKASFGELNFVVAKYEYKGKTKPGFLTVLDSGKVILMSKKVVAYKEQQPPKALEMGPTPAKYTRSPDVFFYKIGDGEVMKVDNIKNMIASFGDKQAELTAFAKKEKVSPKDEDELVRLVRYYNSL